MAIKGSLKEASLPDVLQLLALGQKTGCLSIADRSNFGYIYFDKGRIAYASIVNRRDRLGDILVKHEKISQEQLDAAIHRQAKERNKKLGEILVAQDVLTQQELERYMRMQIEESVYYLFTWTQGRSTSKPTSGRAAGLPRVDQPGVAVARGRPPGGRVGADREEDPVVRSDLCRGRDRSRSATPR